MAPDAPASGPDDPTFRAFASSWLEDDSLEWRPSTVKDIRWRLESHLLPRIGERRLSTFDIPLVTSVKTSLLKGSCRIAERLDAGVVERDARNMPMRPLGNGSINMCVALLSRILDDAVERGYLRDNPARRVRRLRHRAPRRPILEPHEVLAMYAFSPPVGLLRMVRQAGSDGGFQTRISVLGRGSTRYVPSEEVPARAA